MRKWGQTLAVSRRTDYAYGTRHGFGGCGSLSHTFEGNALVYLDLKTGKPKWQQPGFEWGGMVAVDGTLVVLDGKTGEIVRARLSPDHYEELGRLPGLGGQSWTAPIIADGRLIVRNRQTLACYDLRLTDKPAGK